MTSSVATPPLAPRGVHDPQALRVGRPLPQLLLDGPSTLWSKELGAVVVPHYEQVRAILRGNTAFISGEGVGMNDFANTILRGTTLASDNPLHTTLRSIVSNDLGPRAIMDRGPEVGAIAHSLVTARIDGAPFDGVAALAQALPLAVVPDFLGLPDRHREDLFPWSRAGIDLVGPIPPDRLDASLAASKEMFDFACEIVERREVTAGRLAEGVLQAADRGEITPEQCPVLYLDYLGPALETTCTAIGHALALFSRYPDQYDHLRSDPSLIGSAINEVLRFETPVLGFSRVAAQDTELAGMHISAGTRVLALLPTANQDPMKWPEPERFDITRNPTDHVSFGYGVHACAGQGLARLELTALLEALISTVSAIELAGEPTPAESTMLNAYDELPIRFHSA